MLLCCVPTLSQMFSTMFKLRERVPVKTVCKLCVSIFLFSTSSSEVHVADMNELYQAGTPHSVHQYFLSCSDVLLLFFSDQRFLRYSRLWAETSSDQTATFPPAQADAAERQRERLHQRWAVRSGQAEWRPHRELQSNSRRHVFISFTCSDNVFGCHLDTLCHRENNTIPKFVEKCIRAVERRGEHNTHINTHNHEQQTNSWMCVQVWTWTGSTEWVETWPWSRDYDTKLIMVTVCLPAW